MKIVLCLALLSIFAHSSFVHASESTVGSLEILTTAEDDSIQANTVVLKWTGPVQSPMAEELQEGFDKYKAKKQRVILDISSQGGDISEGAAVIELLRKIKKTHELISVVQRGSQCGSMCVPIYLQGSIRIGARTSSWMFHGARLWWTTVPDDAKTEESLQYFYDAGVSAAWVQKILPYLRKPGELWQTGHQLLDQESRIITKPLEDFRELPAITLPTSPSLRPR